MTVTNIKIRKIFAENPLKEGIKAILSITLDNCLAIHEIKVIQGYNRLFVAMPSSKGISFGFRDIVHPLNQETRRNLETIILEAYNDYIAVAEAQTQAEIQA